MKPRVLALLIGGIFVYAGAVKLAELSRFMADVHAFRLLPWKASVGVALYLPWLEILCGLGLQCSRLRRSALLILAALVASFLVAVGSALLRGLDISCGCFGKGSAGSLWVTLFVDLLLLALLALLWRWSAPARFECAPASRGQGGI